MGIFDNLLNLRSGRNSKTVENQFPSEEAKEEMLQKTIARLNNLVNQSKSYLDWKSYPEIKKGDKPSTVENDLERLREALATKWSSSSQINKISRTDKDSMQKILQGLSAQIKAYKNVYNAKIFKK